MKKVLVFIFFILISACEINKDNMIIEGQIIDLKNSKIYLAVVDEGKIIDSANVIDGKFTLKTYINEPIEMSLILKKKIQVKNSIFFLSLQVYYLEVQKKNSYLMHKYRTLNYLQSLKI